MSSRDRIRTFPGYVDEARRSCRILVGDSFSFLGGKSMKTMGIDPGYDGAISILHFREHVSDLPAVTMQIWDLPTFEVMVNRKHKRRLNLSAIATWMDLWSAGIDKVIIENPSPRPGEGVTSAFNFGGVCLALQMAVATQGLSTRLVHPRVWKKALGLGPDKDESRKRAIELYPRSQDFLTRKKDHNRAEAILLAHYGSLIP
jgi:crossover junction endodeoxyribonuclease RuvC